MIVLDASAILAMLRGEPGGDSVAALLIEHEATVCAHAANLCEVFYDQIREYGEASALEVMAKLESLGITSRTDFDAAFWQEIGRLKVAFPLSFCDCIGLALAKRLDADFYTSDRGEMEAVDNQGEIGIVFIR